MTNAMQVISVSAVVVGIVWFLWTGALWQFFPIAAAIVVARFAIQAMPKEKK